MPFIADRHVSSTRYKIPLFPKPKLKIGILGGSFNPCHQGHIYIALQAKKRLGLDQVWLLVSPGNPLKDQATMLPLDERVKRAELCVGSHSFVKVVDVESALGVVRTYDTLNALKGLLQSSQFIWLMGADNLATIDRWYRWQELIDSVQVVVFDRSSMKYKALLGKGYAYGKEKISFVSIKKHPFSATYIRNSWKKVKKCV